MLRRAVELGVNFIDTADSYGPEVSEELIAEALHPYPDDLVIATKGGLERPGPGAVDRRTADPSTFARPCEGSLRRLRLEQIPLYQFHRPDPEVPIEDSIGALVELKDEGKIRHIGLSNVTEQQLRQAQQLTPIVSIQNRYNLADRGSEAMRRPVRAGADRVLPVGTDPGPRRQHGGASGSPSATTSTPCRWRWPGCCARSPAMLPIPGTARSPISRRTSRRPLLR